MLLNLFFGSLVLLVVYVTVWSLCRAFGLVQFGPGDAIADAIDDRLQRIDPPQNSLQPSIYDSTATTDRKFALSVYRILRLTDCQADSILAAAERQKPTGPAAEFVSRVCRRQNGLVPLLFGERDSVLIWSDSCDLLWLSLSCLRPAEASND